MALIKDKYPILEYDEDTNAIIMPNRKGLDDLPSRCAVSFSDAVYKFAGEVGAEVVSEFDTCTKLFKIYRTRYEGQEVCFCEVPLGASASVALLYFLFAYGVEYIVASGSCGVLVDIPENELLVPVRALRDEGASYHYLRPERFVEINEIAGDSLADVEQHGGRGWGESSKEVAFRLSLDAVLRMGKTSGVHGKSYV
jgi:hypothetical protein